MPMQTRSMTRNNEKKSGCEDVCKYYDGFKKKKNTYYKSS